MKFCKWCGLELEGRKRRNKYCGLPCAWNGLAEPIVEFLDEPGKCRTCGVPTRPFSSPRAKKCGQPRKYCSRRCACRASDLMYHRRNPRAGRKGKVSA